LLKKDPRYENINLDRKVKEDLFDKFAEKKRKVRKLRKYLE